MMATTGKEERPKPLVSEVDKTFYELTITDLNRRLARLRTLTSELQEENEQLKQGLKQLDEDRNDVITYLKKVLNDKSEEISMVNRQLKELQKTRDEEVDMYENKIVQMKEDHRLLHLQLTSEIKMLNGKLNALEEFRLQRDELMKKYEAQGVAMEEQEMRHKRVLYETEKKFIVAKDMMKKDMEERLVQLSTEFQEITEIRIASTTHRVIRENIAMNNEMDATLTTNRRLHFEFESMKKINETLRLNASLFEEERNQVLRKNRVQMNIIKRLTGEHDSMKSQLEKYQEIETEVLIFKLKNETLLQEKVKLQNRVKYLEQNLHVSRCERANIKTELDYTKDELDRLAVALNGAIVNVRGAMEIKILSKDKARKSKLEKRAELLENACNTLYNTKRQKPLKPSLISVQSITEVYDKGDLGFIPKTVIHRSRVPIRRHVETEIGGSLEELAASWVPPKPKTESLGEEEEEEEEAMELGAMEISHIFGMSSEAILSVSSEESVKEEGEEGLEEEMREGAEEEEPAAPRVEAPSTEEMPAEEEATSEAAPSTGVPSTLDAESSIVEEEVPKGEEAPEEKGEPAPE